VCNVCYKYIGVTELVIQIVFVRYLDRVLLGFVTNYNAFYGIHSGTLIVKIQEYTNKCAMLQYKDITVQTLEFRSVTLLSCGSSQGILHQYLCKA
jgi:uridine phosphorylase